MSGNRTHPAFLNHQNTRRAAKIVLLLAFILGNLLNLDTGWADNGDYDRVMRWVTSRPVGMENWPQPGSPMWEERFFSYWIPEWELDFPGNETTHISAQLLWAPGIFLNRYFYSSYTLNLTIMSLGARLALFLFLYLAFVWIDRRSDHPLFFYLTLGLPLVLLFCSADVLAFFNSFYQETGAIVFLPFLVGAIVWASTGPRDWKFYLFSGLSLLLAATSKSSLFYIPLLALPFVISLAQLRHRPLIFAPLALTLTVLPITASLTLTHVPTLHPAREYNSLFRGVLMHSQDPQARLDELGMPGALECVGADHYGAQTGTTCLVTYAGMISYGSVVRVLLAEPVIVLRQLDQASLLFQNYTLELGRHASGDRTVRQKLRLNFWSEIKQRFFPHGPLLYLSLGGMAIIATVGWKKPGLTAALSRAALFCLLAVPLDVMVQILGDGQRDLLKHLFVANLFFDFALILSLGILLNLALGLKIPRRAQTQVA